MELNVIQGHSKKVIGDINVVIDVIRAFTTSYYFFSAGVKTIYLANDVESSFNLKSKLPNSFISGEKNAIKIEGFDFGNSPYEISQAANLNNTNIIQKTTNGVTAVFNSMECSKLYVTGLSTAKQLALHLKNNIKPGNVVNFVASHPTSDEDVACADYMISLIKDEPIDLDIICNRIKSSTAAQKFLDKNQKLFNSKDIDFCCKEHSSDFIMKVHLNKDINQPQITMEQL